MAQEIERKFLLADDSWKPAAQGVRYRQGYLCTDKERTVRVRVVGERGLLTVKGMTRGISRAEYEYDIPLQDATQLLDDLCLRPLIEKTRYRVTHGDLTWEIDEFHGENAGLVVAEVELASADQDVPMPDWVGEEVSGDPRYFNSNLGRHPYSRWSES